MDLEKNHAKEETVEVTMSGCSSEPSLELKPKSFDLKPNRDILPEKTGTRLTRYLQFTFFTTYRTLFTFIFTANLATFVAFIAKAKGTPTTSDIANASSANLMIAILFRQEHFVNLCYEIAVSFPHSLPISVRRRLARVFHYGGAHSGSGTASVVWFILYIAVSTRNYIHAPNKDGLMTLVMSYVLLTMLIFILATAHPRFRVKFHDYFEAVHRFLGWASLIVFWIHNGLAARDSAKKEGISTGLYTIKSPIFWFLCITTICIFFSWSQLRRRDVYPEIISDHVIRLHFKYRPIEACYGLKFSTRPLLEWHAFATVPDEDENGKIIGFSVVISNAGDWTKDIIMNPPKKLWVRGFPLHGLLYTARLFKRIVIVATGSGIGPFLSLLQPNITPRRILWSTPHPEATFGANVMNSILKADPDAIIWNTRTLGRPDMVSLTYQLVLESNAEAVFIISNPKVTQQVVYGMETRGIPAYGAIFDS